MNQAAIYYLPDGYDTSHNHLMGRRAAGEAFLKAYAQHPDVAKLYCYTSSEKLYQDFCQRVTSLTKQSPQVQYLPFPELEKLNQVGCLYYPAPGLAELAWQRRHLAGANYSLCGITHTTASRNVIESISRLFTAPVASWDAIICTSTAVKVMLEQLMQRWQMVLEERTGVLIDPKVQLPVIPLGVDVAQFSNTDERAKYRQVIRQKLAIGDNDVVFLFFGRLSFHAKANPLPMFRGLELAAQKTQQKCHLILAGWFANDSIQQAFMNSAQQLCPNVTCHLVDGRKTDVRTKIWTAADVFTSLSDNIQETFGLTPLEAMAAGLPVVVSDWNGYRDTVREGEDGFLIPTYASMPGVNDDIAFMYETDMINYDYYIGAASLNVAIDYEAVAEAYRRLIEDPALRQRLGQQGQQHAKSHYDWPVIIKQYQALWQSLAEQREQSEQPSVATGNPLFTDPMTYFQHYPSELIDETTQVKRKATTTADEVKQFFKCSLSSYHQHLFATEDCLEVFEHLRTSAILVADLIVQFPKIQVKHLIRIVAWLAKVGVVTLEPSTSK